MDQYISMDSQQYFAFNIWSIESAKAVIDAAAQEKQNVILQTSMKAFAELDIEEMAAYVRSYGKKKNVRAYLHLDHCRKIEYVRQAAACGWDSVMIDASDKTLEENIEITNEVTGIVKGKGILVEAEVGQICGQEDGLASVTSGLAAMEDIEKFLRNTDIDMIAAAVGTVHGLYKGTPHIHYDMISDIAGITNIPFVVHGGTGLTDEILLQLLMHKNVKKINISTDVKLAYRRGIEACMHTGKMDKEGFNPLDIQKSIHDSIRDMAAGKMRLTGRTDKGEDNTCTEYGNEKHTKYSV
ncbi:MAG: class II fructose-bisphosphate aldolase [Lachnospiraceae bacterium]|nr:class II fructose-bisphosphate aldolase [Lachnospiraceae bacterium]